MQHLEARNKNKVSDGRNHSEALCIPAAERDPSRYLKAFQLVVSVHNQLGLVAVHPDQHHVLWTVLHVAAHQLVGGAVGEELEEEEEKA